MGKIGSDFMLDKTIGVYNRIEGVIKQKRIPKKTLYRGLLRRNYSPLSPQQEWLKRQILYSK